MQVESFNASQQQLALKTAELEVERGRHQESVDAARQYMAMMVTVNAYEEDAEDGQQLHLATGGAAQPEQEEGNTVSEWDFVLHVAQLRCRQALPANSIKHVSYEGFTGCMLQRAQVLMSVVIWCLVCR